MPPLPRDGALPTQFPHRKGWHSDQSYRRPPPDVSLFFAVTPVRKDQGQTIFADATAAYEALSPELRSRVPMVDFTFFRSSSFVGANAVAFVSSFAMLAVFFFVALYIQNILGFSALAIVWPDGLKSVQDAGPHGFSELLYLFTSATGNNGSAFAGFTGNTPFYNTTGGIAMFAGRFLMIVPMLAIAGSLAAKRSAPVNAGTFPTHGPLFIGLLVGVVLIVGGLTYLPALALGPVVEHLAMMAGTVF